MSRFSIMSPKAAGLLLIVGVPLVLLELSSYLAIEYVVVPRNAGLVYVEPQIDPSVYASYLELRDPDLGWPRVDLIGTDQYDSSGSRPIPSFPEPADACVSLYGDSYTYGAEVSNEDAWSNLLAEKLGCRVSNFGVPGYGTDQAYLRFERNENDEAKLVILGVFHNNIARNLRENYYAAGGRNALSFKPRFILKNGKLELIPIPRIAADDISDFYANPERFISHTWGLAGSENGPKRFSFPYTITLFRIALSHRTRSWLANKPDYLPLYEIEHPSGALPLLLSIVRSFRKVAEARDETFVVVIFPGTSAVHYRNEYGLNIALPLVKRLQDDGIRVIDSMQEILDYLGGRSYCTLLVKPETCSGHLNPEGNLVVAGIIHRHVAGLVSNHDQDLAE